MGDATDIARMLAVRVPELVLELLPNGCRVGAEWRVGSVAGERGQSLAVRLSGARAGVWADFGGSEKGDALDLVGAVLYAGDKRQALIWARRWLGLSQTDAAHPVRPAPPAPAIAQQDDSAEIHRAIAVRMFEAAQPSLRDTPALAYLKNRGIDLSELGRQPRSLRFAPSLWNRESDRSWPALVAAVTNGKGEHMATHRTWLAKDAGGVWHKAPLATPKMSIGHVTGGAIPLWRGTSRTPLAMAPAGEAVAIAEGIETALSVVMACPELRVMSAVSLSNMRAVVLPPAVRTVIVCADNDTDNLQAADALRRAVAHFAAEGRIVKVATPSIGSDFNDVLRSAT
jgi:hypothetical protein